MFLFNNRLLVTLLLLGLGANLRAMEVEGAPVDHFAAHLKLVKEFQENLAPSWVDLYHKDAFSWRVAALLHSLEQKELDETWVGDCLLTLYQRGRKDYTLPLEQQNLGGFDEHIAQVALCRIALAGLQFSKREQGVKMSLCKADSTDLLAALLLRDLEENAVQRRDAHGIVIALHQGNTEAVEKLPAMQRMREEVNRLKPLSKRDLETRCSEGSPHMSDELFSPGGVSSHPAWQGT